MANDRVTRIDVEFPLGATGGQDRVTRVDVEFPFVTTGISGGKDRVTRTDVEFTYIPVRIDQLTRLDVEFTYLAAAQVTCIRIDPEGSLWACLFTNGIGQVVKLNAPEVVAGGPVEPVKRLTNSILSEGDGPTGITFDFDGYIYVCVAGVGICKFAPTAQGSDAPISVVTDTAGYGIA